MTLYWPFPVELVREWPGTRPAGMAPHWGTDFAVDAGTPVPATSDGVIVYVGDDGLGGFTIDLLGDDGLLQRFGHLTWGSARVRVGQRVTPGQIIALSGYSGAVIPRGPDGAHLHWECRRDRAWVAGKWVDPRTLSPETLGDDMSARAEEQIEAIYAAVFGPANLGVEKTTWARPFGEKPGEAFYGMFDVDLRTQQLVLGLQGQIAGLVKALEQLSPGGGGQIDMAAIEAAAARGAREAQANLVLRAEIDDK